MGRRLAPQHAHRPAKARLHHGATGHAYLVYVARAAAAFVSGPVDEPLPPVGVPNFLAVVAAIVHKLHKLCPGDRLRVNFKLRDSDLIRRALVVKCEPFRVIAAQAPAHCRHQHRLARRDRAGHGQLKWRAAGLRQHDQCFALHVFVAQGKAVKVQGPVVLRCFFEQFQRGLQRVQQVPTGRDRVRRFERPAVLGLGLGGVPPEIGTRLNGRQAQHLRLATRAQVALQVAANPPLLKPAGVPERP